MNVPVLFRNNEVGAEPFLSLQPPPGRALTDAVQFETIDLYLQATGLKPNTLLFYMGPAKVHKFVIQLNHIYWTFVMCAVFIMISIYGTQHISCDKVLGVPVKFA